MPTDTSRPELENKIRLLEQEVLDRTRELAAANAALEGEIQIRTQIQAALESSEARYRNLIEQSPLGISIFSPDGNLVYANDAMRRLHGQTREQHAKLLGNYNILKDRQLVERGDFGRIEAAFSGERVVFPPTKYDLKDFVEDKHGGFRDLWVESALYPVKAADGTLEHVILIHKDVSDLKHVEAELQSSLANMNALVEASPIAIALLDVKGRITIWNPAAEKLFGWTSTEVLDDLNPMSPPEKMAVFQENFAAVLNGNTITEMEIQHTSKDGTRIELSLSAGPVRNAAGRTIGVAALMTDISERKKAEEVLIESEERFRILSEAALEGIAITRKGRFVDANSHLAAILGCSVRSLIGRKVTDFVAPEARDMVAEYIRTNYQETYEHLAQRCDGTLVIGYRLCHQGRQGRDCAYYRNCRRYYRCQTHRGRTAENGKARIAGRPRRRHCPRF